jgi:hypothetical protein
MPIQPPSQPGLLWLAIPDNRDVPIHQKPRVMASHDFNPTRRPAGGAQWEPPWQPFPRGLSGYGVTMASNAELPELPANASLITYLRGQASPPDGPGDYTLGPWQLHTHPDLISLLRSLARTCR